MSLIGYARVSTDGQDTALQIDALKAAGCERIFEEHASGSQVDRPELGKCLSYLQEGDILIFWKLDRLGRSLHHLIGIVDDLKNRRIGLRSLTDPIDTTTPAGRLIFQIFGAVAEFERSLNRERVMAGLAAARARGRIGGRRSKYKPAQREAIREEIRVNGMEWACEKYQISHVTAWRYMAIDGAAPLEIDA